MKVQYQIPIYIPQDLKMEWDMLTTTDCQELDVIKNMTSFLLSIPFHFYSMKKREGGDAIIYKIFLIQKLTI